MDDSLKPRYIVFLIDSKSKQHDGKVFASYAEAKEYTHDGMKDHYADKAVIGMFKLCPHATEMFISMVDTIGFSGDKKHVHQLELFKGRG